MGDLTINSPWDETVFKFTKEAIEAASPWKLLQYTNTPNTLDNTIERLWSDSSMAEMATIPAASTTTLEQELLADELFKKLTL